MPTQKKAKEKVELKNTEDTSMDGIKPKRICKPRAKKEMPMQEKSSSLPVTKQIGKKTALDEVAKPTTYKESKNKKAKDKNLGSKSKPKTKDKELKKEIAKPSVTTKDTPKGTKEKAKKDTKQVIAKPSQKSEKKETPKTKLMNGTTAESKPKKEMIKSTGKKTSKDTKSQIQTQQKSKPEIRYSDEDLAIFRNRILEVKQEALEELNMLRERLEDLNSYDLAEEGSIYSMHMAEQGSEIFEKEKVYAQIQRINEYIKKLDEALQRINDKTYGICRVCGILIAKERLLAVPITTLSASYKIHKKCPEDGIDRIEPVNK